MFQSVTLSRRRILGLLQETIEVYVEYLENGHEPKEAMSLAIQKIQEGMDATARGDDDANPHFERYYLEGFGR